MRLVLKLDDVIFGLGNRSIIYFFLFFFKYKIVWVVFIDLWMKKTAEPVSSGAPRVPSVTKSYVIERQAGDDVTLSIPAQGYPVPVFR